jgi:hypothetical protein
MKKQSQCYDKTFGATNTPEPQVYFDAHHKLKSRLGGKPREVSFGPVGGGKVPKSLACIGHPDTDDVTKQ